MIVNTNPNKLVYKENLNRCGARLPETIIVLEEYNRTKDWAELTQKAINENFLNKNSSTTIKTILRCVKNRFADVEGLPNLDTIAYFISIDIPEKAKIQSLLPYICKTDKLIEQYVLRLLGPNINSIAKPDLNKKTFHDFLEDESQSHIELQKWSENSKVRWIRSLLSIFRKFDYMHAAPSFELNKPSLRIETFAFFCIYLILSGESGIEVIQSDIWKYFILSESEIEKSLEEMQRRGWVTFTRSGDIISLKTEFKTMEEWINVIK